MLTHQELWERVKSLEGKTICTLDKGYPNTIISVTDKRIRTAQRQTPVRFNGEWGVYRSYDILHADGYLAIGGNSSGACLTEAIILAAVPEEARKSITGIRLSTKDTKTAAVLCKCGCNEMAAPGSDYIVGHDSKHRSELIERAGGMDGFEATLDIIDLYMSGEYNESELAAGIRRLRAK